MKKIPDWVKRTVYMLAAIISAVLLMKNPVLSFQSDKGIIYIRNYTMDQKMFYVVQTDIATGAEEVSATMSVKGLYYCSWAMLIVTIGCFGCFFNPKWRCHLCNAAIVCASVFYALLVLYVVQITDKYNVTLYPNWAAFLPAVVIQLMLLVRRRTIQSAIDEVSPDEEKEE